MNARTSRGLYIHVPFCAATCGYCHFARTGDHDRELRRRYVAGVLREFELRRRSCGVLDQPRQPLGSCYIGGGTPSCLEPDLLAALLQGTLGRLPRADDCEVTAEANPESFTGELAEAWRGLGVGRVSLGIQSLNDGRLTWLGRRCDAATARRALDLACGLFRRVAADWILGPDCRADELCGELDEAVDRGVEHFSLYILEVRPGTELAAAVAAGRITLPPDASVEKLYLRAAAHLARRGIAQYEVANFARPGAESRHNRAYWRRAPYLGLGPGAHGCWAGRRYANFRDIERWLGELNAGRIPEEQVDPVDRRARRLERVVLALRTREGVPLRWLSADPGRWRPGVQEGLWRLEDGCLRLTPRGFLRIDTIEEALLGAV